MTSSQACSMVVGQFLTQKFLAVVAGNPAGGLKHNRAKRVAW